MRDRRNEQMVDALVRAGAIRSRRIEAAFRSVPRRRFVPGAGLDEVYTDRALVTRRDGDGLPVSSSTQPSLMGEMLEQLAVEPGMSVLEIGTGTGYNAAVLGQLVGHTGAVLTVDVDPTVTGPAARRLAAAGASNVTVLTADGWGPVTGGAVFDRVQVTVGAWDISPAWVGPLAPAGVVVVPVWLRAGQQASIAFRDTGAGLRSTSVVPCGFMRMRGPGAGEPSYRQVGAWTVSVDRDDPGRISVLAALLGSERSARPAPPLDRGWFTAVALAEDGAVHMFAEGDWGPIVREGILQLSPPGLAVVESRPLATAAETTIRAFGDDGALARLLDLLASGPAIDLSRLTVTAHPTDGSGQHGDALARLVRPNYTLVIRS